MEGEVAYQGAGSQRSGTLKRFKESRRRWTSTVRRYLHAARSQLSTRVVRIKSKAARSRFLKFKLWSHRYNVFLKYHNLAGTPWSPVLDLRVGAIGTKAVPLRVFLQIDESWCLLSPEEQCAVPRGWPSVSGGVKRKSTQQS